VLATNYASIIDEPESKSRNLFSIFENVFHRQKRSWQDGNPSVGD